MEALAAASGVIAVVSLAGQVVQGCDYLLNVFSDASGAPESLSLLIKELAIIERLISQGPGQRLNTSNTPEAEYQDALDFANEAIQKLERVVDKYGELNGANRSRKWGRRLAWAMSSDKIEKHLHRLRDASSHLKHYHDRLSQERVLNSIHQLQIHHTGTNTLLNNTVAQIEDMKRHISDNTESSLREFARELMTREDQGTVQMTSAVERTIRDLFAEYLVGSPSYISRLCYSQLNGSNHCTNIPSKAQSLSTINSDATAQQSLSLDTRTNNRLSTSTLMCRLESFRTLSNSDRTCQMNDPDRPQMETSSHFKTIRGEIYMRAASNTYESINEMNNVSTSIRWAGLQFPITISTVEILVLPQSWSLLRGGSVLCQAIQPTVETKPMRAIMSANVEAFGLALQNVDSTERTHLSSPQLPETQKDILTKAPNPSQKPSLLLYWAFKAAFATKRAKLPSFTRKSPSRRTRNSSLRKSFDDDINNALEIVHLWLESNLSSSFLADVLSEDIIHRSEVLHSATQHQTAWHKLRYDYINRLVNEMIEATDTELEHRLEVVHDTFWTKGRIFGFESLQYIWRTFTKLRRKRFSFVLTSVIYTDDLSKLRELVSGVMLHIYPASIPKTTSWRPESGHEFRPAKIPFCLWCYECGASNGGCHYQGARYAKRFQSQPWCLSFFIGYGMTCVPW